MYMLGDERVGLDVLGCILIYTHVVLNNLIVDILHAVNFSLISVCYHRGPAMSGTCKTAFADLEANMKN